MFKTTSCICVILLSVVAPVVSLSPCFTTFAGNWTFPWDEGLSQDWRGFTLAISEGETAVVVGNGSFSYGYEYCEESQVCGGCFPGCRLSGALSSFALAVPATWSVTGPTSINMYLNVTAAALSCAGSFPTCPMCTGTWGGAPFPVATVLFKDLFGKGYFQDGMVDASITVDGWDSDCRSASVFVRLFGTSGYSTNLEQTFNVTYTPLPIVTPAPPISSKSLSRSELIGLIAGGVVLLGSGIAIVAYMRRQKQKNNRPDGSRRTSEDITDTASINATREAVTSVGASTPTGGSDGAILIDASAVGVVEWDDLTVIGELGTGAQGRVLRVQDKYTRTTMALKVFSHVNTRREIAAAVKEVQNLVDIRHPNCLGYLGFCMIQGNTFGVLTEFKAGGDLSQCYQTLGRAEKSRILLEVTKGLAYLHRTKIVHADVKPSNILLDADSVVLADFGLSGSLASSGYTPAYAAPEVIKGAKCDARGDIYSFGVVWLEILLGQKPFRHLPASRSAANADEPPYATLAGAGEDFAWASRCVQNDPSLRPTAHDVVGALTTIWRGLRQSTTTLIP